MNKKQNETQKMLENWLQYLIDKYGYGKECKLVWEPKEVVEELFKGIDAEIDGRVEGQTIYVYAEDPEEARKILTHEYFEYVFDKVLIGRYVDLFESVTGGLIEAFEKIGYKDKEGLIEVLVKIEEQCKEEKEKCEK